VPEKTKISSQVGSPRQSTEIDVHVGARLESQRREIGWTRQQLSQASGLSIAQLQKYEVGVNRLSASRLYQFSILLGVPVSWFFEEVPTPSEAVQVAKLVASYNGIADEASREEIVRMAQNLARLSPKPKTE
jgi:transcriptional regulator with XRE-family HTH domain